MNVSQLKAAIHEADARIPVLETLVDKLAKARRALLVSDDPDDLRLVRHVEDGTSSFWGARSPEARRLLTGWNGESLRAAESELATLKERRELLVAKLPSPAEIEEAEAKVSAELEAMRAAEATFSAAWGALLEALETVKETAVTLGEARSEVFRRGTEARKLAEEVGIDAPGAPPSGGSWQGLTPPAEEQRLALALVEVASQAAAGQRVDSLALLHARKAEDRKAA